MSSIKPGLRIEATRFTVTPPLDVVDVHNVQVQVEQRRDGRWTVAYQGLWFDAMGAQWDACGVTAEKCSHDFATAMRVAVEVAERITEGHRRG
jgi:hypothetical protein